MAQLYRFYITNGEDAETLGLVWADSDADAYNKGFEQVPMRRLRMAADKWITDDNSAEDTFYTTLNILDEAQAVMPKTTPSQTPLADAIDELLWQYIEEMSPAMSESTRASQMSGLRDEMLKEHRATIASNFPELAAWIGY